MNDWRSYDGIATRFDRLWSARFEAIARRIWAFIPPDAGDKLLDIGTGTGIVPGVRHDAAPGAGLTVGCDHSAGMLRQARERLTGLRVVVADAAALPFRGESFDVVTASFVLSHVRDYPSALSEALQVLRASGTMAVSSWAPSSDPYTAAWGECLAEAISKREAERALAEVTPWEAHFSRQGALEEALARAGFSPVASDAIDVESDFTIDQFLEGRELSSGGRLASHLLGADCWAEFRRAASDTFRTLFGPSIRYRRCAFLAVARKP